MSNEIQGSEVVIDEQDLTEVNDFTPEQIADEKTDWKAEAERLAGIAKRRTTALRKLKDGTKKPADNSGTQASKKGEVDYAQKAYMVSMGIKDAADQAFVQGIMKNTGQSIDEVLADEYVTSKLGKMSEERRTKAAQPQDGGRSGQGSRTEVDYWIAKGTLPPKDQPELRRKVVNEKMKRSSGEGMFYNS